MKNYLFIDTASGTRALLEVNGNRYYVEDLKNAGSQTLMPMIDGLLKKANVAIGDIDVLGACIGPGSFTGLRIGLTTIKTLCYALGKPCFAVNNLRLLSYNNTEHKVISLADAGNKVCYVARYDGDTAEMPETCMTIEDAKAFVAAHPDYAVSVDQKISGVFQGAVGYGERELVIAVQKHIDNAIDQKELLPLYVRKAQPERGAGDL